MKTKLEIEIDMPLEVIEEAFRKDMGFLPGFSNVRKEWLCVMAEERLKDYIEKLNKSKDRSWEWHKKQILKGIKSLQDESKLNGRDK